MTIISDMTPLEMQSIAAQCLLLLVVKHRNGRDDEADVADAPGAGGSKATIDRTGRRAARVKRLTKNLTRAQGRMGPGRLRARLYWSLQDDALVLALRVPIYNIVGPAGAWLGSSEEPYADGVWEVGRLDLHTAPEDVLGAIEAVVAFARRQKKSEPGKRALVKASSDRVTTVKRSQSRPRSPADGTSTHDPMHAAAWPRAS